VHGYGMERRGHGVDVDVRVGADHALALIFRARK
jgi:hypothetical protein